MVYTNMANSHQRLRWQVRFRIKNRIRQKSIIYFKSISKFVIEMGTQAPSPEDLTKLIKRLASSIENNLDKPASMYERSELFCDLEKLNAENITKGHWR